jgi:hypothetical protein
MESIKEVSLEIASHFCIPSSDHLWLLLICKILGIPLLVGWFCSIEMAKPDPNLSENTGKIFFTEALMFSF